MEIFGGGVLLLFLAFVSGNVSVKSRSSALKLPPLHSFFHLFCFILFYFILDIFIYFSVLVSRLSFTSRVLSWWLGSGL